MVPVTVLLTLVLKANKAAMTTTQIPFEDEEAALKAVEVIRATHGEDFIVTTALLHEMTADAVA